MRSGILTGKREGDCEKNSYTESHAGVEKNGYIDDKRDDRER